VAGDLGGAPALLVGMRGRAVGDASAFVAQLWLAFSEVCGRARSSDQRDSAAPQFPLDSILRAQSPCAFSSA
jgi:hypothetical protein